MERVPIFMGEFDPIMAMNSETDQHLGMRGGSYPTLQLEGWTWRYHS